MTNYEITLEIESQTLSLSQIAAVLGADGSEFSHNKGDRRMSKSSWDETTWKTVPIQDTDIESVLTQLLHHPVIATLQNKRAALGDICAFVNLAVFHQSYTYSFSIPQTLLSRIGEIGLDLSVSCYPCEE